MADKVYDRPMIGKGTVLAAAATAAPLDLSTPPTTVALAWIKDVNTGWQMGELEWENLGTAAQRRMPTIFDGDHLSGTLQFLPGDTSNKTLYALMKAGTVVYWSVTLPDTSSFGFNGFVTKLSPKVGGVKEETDADFEIAVDGDVKVTPVVGP